MSWSHRRFWVLWTQFGYSSKGRKLLHTETLVTLQPFSKLLYLIFNAFGISNKKSIHGWALGVTGYYFHVIYDIVFEIPLNWPSNCAKCAGFQSNTCLHIIGGHRVKQMYHLLKSQGAWHPGTSCQSGNPFISTSWHWDRFLLLPPWDTAWRTNHLPSAGMARFLPCGITPSSEHWVWLYIHPAAISHVHAKHHHSRNLFFCLCFQEVLVFPSHSTGQNITGVWI